MDAEHWAKLAHWIWEVCREREFSTRTLQLATYYLDCYLRKNDVQVQHLQLIASGCLLLASDTLEAERCSEQDMSELAEGTYTEDDCGRAAALLALEVAVSGQPQIPVDFVAALLAAWPECTPQAADLAHVIMDLTLLDAGLLDSEPWLLAAATVLAADELTHHHLSESEFTLDLQLEASSLVQCKDRVLKVFQAALHQPTAEQADICEYYAYD